jgi:hypothetical protein
MSNVPWNDVGGSPCCCGVTCLQQVPTGAYKNIEITAAQFDELYLGGTATCNFLMNGTSTFDRISVCYLVTVNGTSGGTVNWTMDPNLCNRLAFSGVQPPGVVTSTGSGSGTAIAKTTPCSIPTFRRFRTIPLAFMDYAIYNSGGLYPYGIVIQLTFSGRIEYTVGSNSANAELVRVTTNNNPSNSTVVLQLQSGNITVPTRDTVSQAPFETTTANWTTPPSTIIFTPPPP